MTLPWVSEEGNLHPENNREIARILVEKGMEVFNSPRTHVDLAGTWDADSLLNDLGNHPHAFVLACVMDRQVKAEVAWLIRYRFAEKLGDFEFSTLQSLSQSKVEELMTQPSSLHRFPARM